MKNVRLEFPLRERGNPEALQSQRSFIRVAEKKAETFWDKEFTQPASDAKELFTMQVEVPDELRQVIVAPPSRCAPPVDAIQMGWCWEPDGIMPGLKKLTIIVPTAESFEVPVSGERPDFTTWREHLSVDGKGRIWFMFPWALAIYVTEQETSGVLYWDKKLARNPVRFRAH